MLLAGLLLVAAQTRSLASAWHATPALIVDLARVLHDSPLPMRSDFAWLAISQMAGFYTEEAARARREARHTSRARNAARWAAAVDDYARKMALLADSITATTPIGINVDNNGSVYIYVDGQPVILTGAIGGQQSVYEQRILERFCTLYICEDLLPAVEYSDRGLPDELAATDKATAYWSFSQHAGPVCMTDDGLEFQFRDMSDFSEKRAACTRAVAELSKLASAIERHIHQGVRIDWNMLGILPDPGADTRRVMLAAAQEIQLDLPMLADNPELLKIVRPWLRARVQGNDFQLVVLNAGRLMGLEGGPAISPADSTANQRYPAFNTVKE
jgi:hypothetical protein